MNIGIVTTWYERGASYVSQQYARTLENSNNIFIYARAGFDPNYNKDYDITVDKNANLFVRGEINISQYKNWLISKKIDLVIFNEQSWWKPVLTTINQGIACGAYIDYYTSDTVPFFELYDFLLCNTKRHFSVFTKFKNAIYIPWGTEVDIFKPKSIKKDDSDITFFHSAGWSPYRKGTDLLLEAANKIKLPFKLIIHSQKDLLKVFPEKGNLIKKLLNNKKLEIINQTVAAPGLYHLGDVYVYPTRLEGIGLTIAEALAVGLPAIVPNNGPMNEFISPLTCKLSDISSYKKRSDNYYWDTCEVDISSLSEKMEWYILNKEKIEELKKLTRSHALRDLDWYKNSISLNEKLKHIKPTNKNDKLIKQTVHYDFKQMKMSWLYKLVPSLYSNLVKTYRRYKIKKIK